MKGYGRRLIWRRPRIQIVAFYTDVENKAEVITDGTHIVLQVTSMMKDWSRW